MHTEVSKLVLKGTMDIARPRLYEGKNKGYKLEADWLKEGRKDNDWINEMMTALSLTARESGSDVKNRLAAEHLSKQEDEGSRSSLLN